ncbi:D-TA family PLP-dependent enzyme [Robiginitalea sp. SC105]|uniref:D-TA family PLP-dependent enzyme n=1 Tax=Robiginitalea sp. SC105 TaxID=2762332 RepID=UPI00163B3263|nr:D-TA family PLP-dependent enzyme [Robiginitalea sp. SC105]MBC2837877.1 D-TA family PLP-dependent enzyme [Robiginitalea sp. SC105]
MAINQADKAAGDQEKEKSPGAGAALAWYEIENAAEVPSPALLVYPERIRENIDAMVRIAGSPTRLRPHIKTHKTAEIIRMQLDRGITRFKCATIAEAELLGQCGAGDILLAYQPVGPDQERFLKLQAAFPNARFAALADHPETVAQMGKLAGESGSKIRLFLDLNTGMDRTGIPPGPEAEALYKKIAGHPALEACGLHAYDGHIRPTDPRERQAACDMAFAGVTRLKASLEAAGLPVPTVIAGGSPSFPMHAKRKGVELSPGTTLLWDARYQELFPEMPFKIAAVLLTRVISHPGPGTICLDLGHKAIAPEMDFPRVVLPALPSCRQSGQSEEHLVLSCGIGEPPAVGEVIYGFPMHICPTVAKYPELLVVQGHRVQSSWRVAARDYKLTI